MGNQNQTDQDRQAQGRRAGEDAARGGSDQRGRQTPPKRSDGSQGGEQQFPGQGNGRGEAPIAESNNPGLRKAPVETDGTNEEEGDALGSIDSDDDKDPAPGKTM